MTRSLVCLLVLAAACSKSTPADPCTRAFDKVQALGGFGGDTYGIDAAMAIGLGCKDLAAADLTCIDHASSIGDVRACRHALQVIAGELGLLGSDHSGGAPVDPATATTVADAICGCHDLACIVGVAEREHDHLEEIMRGGKPTDPKAKDAVERVGECVAKIPGATAESR